MFTIQGGDANHDCRLRRSGAVTEGAQRLRGDLVGPARANGCVLLIALMLSNPGSVAPVHDGRDLPDNCSPAERSGRLRPNFPESSAREERTEAAVVDGTQPLVEVVEG